MGKKVRLSELSKTVLIDQLHLCWRHFRACAQALRGEDVQPVELLECEDLGDCDDLELFYLCRKTSEELSYLNRQNRSKSHYDETEGD